MLVLKVDICILKIAPMADDEEEEVVVAPKIERKRDKESTMATRRGRPIKINPKYGAATDGKCLKW